MAQPKRLILGLFLLALPLALGGWSPAPADSVAGSYRRATPSRADLRISAAPGGWRLEIRAGGVPRGPDGAGTAADCISVAVGPRVGDRIVGKLVPYEVDDASITAEELGEGGQLIVVLRPGEVEVVRSDGEKLCGLGSDLSGRYKHVRDRPSGRGARE